MSALQKPEYEAFAQARASGVKLEDAYEMAGYSTGQGHASRLAARPEIMERVAELRRQRAEAEDASPAAIVTALIRLARASEELKTPASLKEARLHLIEAHRLSAELAEVRRLDRATLARVELNDNKRLAQSGAAGQPPAAAP